MVQTPPLPMLQFFFVTKIIWGWKNFPLRGYRRAAGNVCFNVPEWLLEDSLWITGLKNNFLNGIFLSHFSVLKKFEGKKRLRQHSAHITKEQRTTTSLGIDIAEPVHAWRKELFKHTMWTETTCLAARCIKRHDVNREGCSWSVVHTVLLYIEISWRHTQADELLSALSHSAGARRFRDDTNRHTNGQKDRETERNVVYR